MGVSYFKLGYTDKAANFFAKIQDKADMYYVMSAYYKALICKEAGDNAGYQACVDLLKCNAVPSESETENEYLCWRTLWAQSRLDDLQG